jgi:hypothetical protein
MSFLVSFYVDGKVMPASVAHAIAPSVLTNPPRKAVPMLSASAASKLARTDATRSSASRKSVKVLVVEVAVDIDDALDR